MPRDVKLDDTILAERKIWGAGPVTAIIALGYRVTGWTAAANIARGHVVVVAGNWVVVFYLRRIVAAATIVAKKVVAASFGDIVDLVVDI